MNLCLKHSERGAKLLAVVALAIGTLAAAQAGEITYNINFTNDFSDVPPPTGSFTYNAATSQFTNFTVNWDAVTFDLTSSANTFGGGPGAPAYVGNLSGGAAAFAWLSPGCQTFPDSSNASAEPEDNTEVAVFDFVESDTVQIGSNEVNGANAIDGDTGARGNFTIRGGAADKFFGDSRAGNGGIGGGRTGAGSAAETPAREIWRGGEIGETDSP
jgi:hypothetical protein